MNADTTFSAEQTAGSGRTYGFTFGVYNQTAPWTEVRRVTWSALARRLTAYEIGPKEGTCIVPAVFRGTRRRQDKADQIDVAFLDSDGGYTLDEIRARISAQGWAGIVHSTHSHLTAVTRVKMSNWNKFGERYKGEDAAEAFLIQEKGYLPRIAKGAAVLHEAGEYVFLSHQPCPKFRIAVPLLRPWRAADYPNQETANDAWRTLIEELADALGLHHDESCSDTSRLFYLPRCPVNGPPPETAVLEGGPCGLTPPIAQESRSGGTARRGNRHGRADDTRDFTDPDTGEVLDLVAWSRECGGRFQIVEAIRARKPEVFVGRVAGGTRHHIRCVNAGEHTDSGDDTATYVINADASTSKGWVYHCRHAHCDRRDRILFLRKMLEEKWLRVDDLTDSRFLTDKSNRTLIRCAGGEIASIVDQAEAALIVGDVALYQRGTFLVRPGRAMIKVSGGRHISAQRIFAVEDRALAEEMTVVADWEKFDKRSDDWVRIDAPITVAQTYQQRRGRWRLPVLTGLIDAPTLRPDGSILNRPGYDGDTGLLLDTSGVRYPAISERPSRDEARDAVAVLSSLLAQFPFVSGADRSVALSAILSACIRRSLATVPLHAFTAPTAGSGKSLLVDIASAVATGREAGVIAQSKKEDELEKRLSALLLAGESVIAIDNCEAPLGSEFLCSMLTQQAVRPRILGKSEAPELPSNSFVTATGNNLVLVGDLTRRAVLCRLDPKVERPELREFSTNPIAAVKADRGRYVGAVLTVLRAYHVAGRPDAPLPLGSFEDWSWVRGALVWLGEQDPVATMEEVRSHDPKLDALTAVMRQWKIAVGTARMSVRDIIECATRQEKQSGAMTVTDRMDFRFPEFREALLAVAGDAGAINGRRLGRFIASYEKRVVGDMRLVRDGDAGGAAVWKLEQLNVVS